VTEGTARHVLKPVPLAVVVATDLHCDIGGGAIAISD
jgi:hypothetical protein